MQLGADAAPITIRDGAYLFRIETVGPMEG